MGKWNACEISMHVNSHIYSGFEDLCICSVKEVITTLIIGGICVEGSYAGWIQLGGGVDMYGWRWWLDGEIEEELVGL